MENLVAKGLGKRYGRAWALRGVSLAVQPGQCLGVLGHNGSGKSTLLAVLAGVQRASEGQVLLGGAELRARAQRRRIGYAPQRPGLMDELTVGENLRFWQGVYGLRGEGCLPELCGALGLAPLLPKRAGALSGGMRQRVSLAAALLHGPGYILLDEPFAALDAKYARALTALLQARMAQGAGVVLCTHLPQAAAQLCGEVLVLRGGRQAAWRSVQGLGPQPEQALAVLLGEEEENEPDGRAGGLSRYNEEDMEYGVQKLWLPPAG